MDAVLARLAFRNPLEEEPGFDAGGVRAGRHITKRRPPGDRDHVLDGEPAGGDQMVHEFRMILDLATEHCRPEGGLSMGSAQSIVTWVRMP